MFKTALNTIAKAKLIHNKKLSNKKIQLYKVIIAFNVQQRFPVQAKCAYISGDVTLAQVASVLQKASIALRTTNIVLVK